MPKYTPIVSILIALFAYIASGFSFAVLFVTLVIFMGILVELRITPKLQRNRCCNLLFCVFAVYVISSVFFAPAFENGKYYMLMDSTQYFSLLNMSHMDLNVQDRLESCYLLFDDSDALHLIYVRYLILFANKWLDGANVNYLMLTNAFWGIIAAAAVYRVLVKIVSPRKAFTYTLVFALLSPFHFYSIGFVRDIIIASFYAHAIEIVLSKFKFWKIFVLLLFIIVVWGIRLYSGLFLFMFIAIYLYSSFGQSKLVKILSVTIAVASIVVAIPIIIRSELYNQFAEELEAFQEFDQGQMTSSSLSRGFDKLPHGPREIGLILFSQMQPFPFYDNLKHAENISQYYIGFVSGVFGVYWYLISFGLFIMLLFKKYSKYLTLEDWLFFTACLTFILINTVQIHVRRIMPVYPLMLYLFVKMMENHRQRSLKSSKILMMLGFSYVVLIITYIVLKS